MNIKTLKAMRIIDILKLKRKDVREIGCDNIVAMLGKKTNKHIWLVYGCDIYDRPCLICAAASKKAAEHIINTVAEFATMDRYYGPACKDFYIKEVPFGGFDTEAIKINDGEFVYMVNEPRC